MKKTRHKIGTWVLSLMAVVIMTTAALAGQTVQAYGANHPFSDVKAGDWYAPAVSYVYEQGLMGGTGKATFSPDSPTTRGMIVTILHRMEGEPYVRGQAFSDVSSGQYYANAVGWASANGIVSGYGNGRFGPNDLITREQLAAILYRYAGYKGDACAELGNIWGFEDARSVSSYAVSAMEWAIGAGLISGVGENRLSPGGSATRAQAATILMRFCQRDESSAEGESILESGIYTFYNASAGRYLSRSGNDLILSPTPQNWEVKDATQTGRYVYAEETSLLLDIDNAWVKEGTSVKLWTLTGYDVQIWDVVRNQNGTYSFLYSGDHRYCIGLQNGRTVLQLRSNTNRTQEWTVESQADQFYYAVKSSGGIIQLQLAPDITSVISHARLQKWADDLETAYATFYELTGYVPYNTVVVEGYKPCKYTGYVTQDCNIIRIDRDFLYTDLAKMAQRENDWNFCALHEMGHMFDNRRPWCFETEMMTDLKLAYVLERHNASAAPSEFAASVCFTGKDIIYAYEQLGTDFSSTYSIYGCAHRFLQIKEQVGWEAFRQTFHAMQANADKYASATKQEQLVAFVELLSQYSGVDVRGYFSSGEWNTFLRATEQ